MEKDNVKGREFFDYDTIIIEDNSMDDNQRQTHLV